MTRHEDTSDGETVATVERIVPGGVGLTRVRGRAVLLPGTAPGDTVTVSVGGPGGPLARVVEPSRLRVQPVCQDVDTCGGCDLMHLRYRSQLDAKVDMLEDCLRRIARLARWPGVRVIASPAELGYRWRAAFHVASDGTLGYKARRSNEVVPIRRCHVIDPALESWRARFDASGMEPGTRVSAMTDGERVATTGEGAGPLEVGVGGESYLATPDAFFQGNAALVEGLVDEVVRLADARSTDAVLDLYAGAGLFTVPMARRARTVSAIEGDARSIALLAGTLERAGIGNVTVRTERVERAMGAPVRRSGFDVVILDPPRIGVGAAVVKGIIRRTPRRVVMVSCDPATFARDVATFAAGGYMLRELTVLDMFPQTHHLEVVGLLTPA